MNVFHMVSVSYPEMILWDGGFFKLDFFFLFTTVLKYFPRMENSEAVKLYDSLSLTYDVSAGIKI